ncbi:MAG: cytochrome c biogenesis protein CcdA [Patescibacteria group bacterium]
MLLLLIFAFLGGVVTILSPCILPILPIILSGSVGGGKKKPYGIVTGFVVSFTFFTLFLTSIVNATGVSADILRTLSVVILFAFGLTLLLPQVQAKLEMLFSKLASRVPQQGTKDGFSGGFVIGLSLGLLWTPCVGPILASVISLALTGSVTGSAVFITLAYALGTAIPMFIIMYGGRALLNRVPWLLENTGKIQKAFGVIMIITSIGIFYNVDRSFQTYILEKFPQYGTGLTSFEDNDLINKELDELDMGSADSMQIHRSGETDSSSGPVAPEIIPGGEWFNSDELTLEGLQGKVVMLDFMTYSCINCIRTFPYLRAWHDTYADDGLVIIGIHTPEFEFEKDPDNVREALEDFDLTFPVVQDNDYATWRAYGNRYWPRKYLINYKGEVVYDHIGEGAYDETEKIIRQLLEEKNSVMGVEATVDEVTSVQTDSPQGRSPEVYFGAWRNELLGNGKSHTTGVAAFIEPEVVLPNTLYLVGEWDITTEYAESLSEDAGVIFKYEAKNVFFVAGSETISEIDVYQDDQLVGTVKVNEETLYEAILGDMVEQNVIKLQMPDPGTRIYTFTFG